MTFSQTFRAIPFLILLGCTPVEQTEPLQPDTRPPATGTVRHWNPVVVRAFSEQSPPGQSPTEVHAAECRLESPEFSLAFRSPARLNLPVLSRKPAPLTLTCQKAGATGTKRMEASRMGKSELCNNAIVLGGVIGNDFYPNGIPFKNRPSWEFATRDSTVWVPLNED